jgi:KDO2-lipid IV(A) lauroyltransferase
MGALPHQIGLMPRLDRFTFYKTLARLPLPLLHGLASLLYPLLYYVARYRRRTVADNLAHAFPELTGAERRALEQRFYRHITDLLVEVFAARFMTRADFAARVKVANPEILQPFIDQQQSILLLGLHMGNWEWMLPRLADIFPCPVAGIYKPLHDDAMDRFIQEVRARSIHPVPFEKAGKEMLRRRREFRVFSMLADQAPFKRDARYWHPFFNRTASFYLGPQKLAEVTQYPVVFVAMIKRERGHYEMFFEVLAQPPHERDNFTILDSYIDAAERAIRRQPELWLWSNRKWKHQPPADATTSTEAAKTPAN